MECLECHLNQFFGSQSATEASTVPKCLCPEIEMPRWTGVASISECAIAWLFLLQLCKSLKGQQNLLDVFLTELCGLCILYLFVSCLSADLKPIRMPSQKSIEASANAQGKQRNIKTPPRGIGNEALQRSTTSVSCHVAR